VAGGSKQKNAFGPFRISYAVCGVNESSEPNLDY
jgi:hypothetical protein